jgi:hypothetical protein
MFRQQLNSKFSESEKREKHPTLLRVRTSAIKKRRTKKGGRGIGGKEHLDKGRMYVAIKVNRGMFYFTNILCDLIRYFVALFFVHMNKS